MRAIIISISFLTLSIGSRAAEETTTYHNPVDEKDYTTKWKTYTAKPAGTVAPQGKVDMESFRLLAEQPLFDRNVSVDKLAAFIKSAQDRISAAVPKTAPRFELFVQVTLSAAARPKFEMSSKGDAPEALLQKIQDSLAATPDLRSKVDALPFQMHFMVREKP
jgi:hypothetical protein